jgi:hypothetical protein
MVRRKPPPRVVTQRSSDNEKRRLRSNLPNLQARQDLAERVSYGCYSKHKFHPRVFGLEPFAGTAEDRTYCDAHAGFQPADMPRIDRLLRRGIMAGLWSENNSQGDPSILWTVDDNGWIYEIRITIPGRANYHAYPLLPNDAFSRKILSHFIIWASGLEEQEIKDDPMVQDAMRAAQERYR